MDSHTTRPYLRDGVDVYVTDDFHNVTFVFLSTRKRIAVNCQPDLTRLLTSCDGTATIEELANRTAEPAKGMAFLRYLISNNVLVDARWFENLRLPDAYKDRIKKQLYFLMDMVTSVSDVERVQMTIMNTRVAIVGVGGVGSWIATELAMMGFTRFLLVDYDNVSASDATRHSHFKRSGVGMSKVQFYADVLRGLATEISVDVSQTVLSSNTDMDKLFHDVNIIINAADEPYIGYTSIALSRFCIITGKVMYVAGGFDAHLGCLGELIVPKVTPCADCYATYFRNVLKNWKPAAHPIKNRTHGFGGLASLTVFSASSAALSLLRYLVDSACTQGGRGEFKFTDYSLDSFEVKRDPTCRHCA
jgi:molybdopterin/thiamine biosynthesis adenylyltransferase